MSEKEFKKIDLGELLPEELPTQEIEITLKNGKKQTITVEVINGEGRIAWSTAPQNVNESIKYEANAIKLALVYGARMSEAEAEMFMNADPENAHLIGMIIWNMTVEFVHAMRKERDDAKKNSETAEANTDKSSASATEAET